MPPEVATGFPSHVPARPEYSPQCTNIPKRASRHQAIRASRPAGGSPATPPAITPQAASSSTHCAISTRRVIPDRLLVLESGYPGEAIAHGAGSLADRSPSIVHRSPFSVQYRGTWSRDVGPPGLKSGPAGTEVPAPHHLPPAHPPAANLQPPAQRPARGA